MSGDSRFRSVGAEDWVEQLRDAKRREPAPGVNEAVLEAAYNASEIDSAMMFAYFEGGLTEEERRELEAEIALSPHAFSKLARIGAIVAKNRAGSRILSEPVAARNPSGALESLPAEPKRIVYRVRLPEPQPSAGGHYLPRAEDCIREAADSPCEFHRSLQKDRDQLRIFHHAAPVGTLVEVKITQPDDAAGSRLTQFAVLRPSSETMTTATLTIPDSYRRGEVILELVEMPAGELSAEDSVWVLQSYHRAAVEDPVAVTPLHEPRSAWQIWADQVLKLPAEEVDPTVREVAEQIARF